MSKRIMIGLAVLVLAAGGGWAWWAVSPRPPKARVDAATPTRGEFIVSLGTEGALQSDNSVVVRTGKAPGQITMIVPDGTILRAGDVFCRIESRDLLRKQADAELAYMQAEEEIEKTSDSAQENYDNAQRAVDQAEKDFGVWEASTSIRTKQAEAQLEFDRAETERLQTEYARAQRMADKGYQAGAEADLAKAAWDAQQFKVEQSVKNLDLNRRKIEAERVQRQGVVSAARQRATISRNRIQQQVAHATSRAQVAANQLKTVVGALADATILAPVSGTVSLNSTYQGGERRSWREGDQVQTSAQLGAISGTESMSIRCRIKESDIASLREGQEADIDFDALTGRTFKGVVSSVGTVAREVWVWEDPTAEANERVFDVVIKVKQTRLDGLKPGLNARVKILLKRIPGALFVPLEAVFEREGKSFVYTKQGDGFARRDVQTGDRNDVAVVILSGLSAGEAIALSDPTRRPAAATRKGS